RNHHELFHACFPHAASRPYSLRRSLVALSQGLLDPHEGSGRSPSSPGTGCRQLRLSHARPTGGAVVRNKAEQYRSRARLCLEVARTLSPGKKRLMDRATLIDMAQTWLRLAQEEEQEAANRSDVVGRSEVVQQQPQIQINKKD